MIDFSHTRVAIELTLTGTLATLVESVILLLLFVFFSTNLSVLILRRDEVAEDHFRIPRWVPVLAIVSCLVLLSQQSLKIWMRAGALIVIGSLLFACSRAALPAPVEPS